MVPLMTQMSKRSKEEQGQNSKKVPLACAALLLVTLLIVYVVQNNQSSDVLPKAAAAVETHSPPSEMSPQRTSASMPTNGSSSEIRTGRVNDIPYYHCAGTNDHPQHLVLLHGARFTKEDWKTSGILTNLCQAAGLSVSALDLSVSANHQDLQRLLTAMQQEGLLTRPVVLVTPSASGNTMATWMTDGAVQELPSYISTWIPIATFAVLRLNDEQVRSLDGLDNLSILAMYGSRDAKGRQVAERLAHLAGATTLEMEGGHPCYLDSPDTFVAAVLETMNISV